MNCLELSTSGESQGVATIKCLVWDLDNTLWQGTLAEGDEVVVTPEVRHIIATLDERGILQSIASKNEAELVQPMLRRMQLEEYFLHPQINWSPKSLSIGRIARLLNIATDAIAFIDDERYERDEVASELADVLCIDAAELSGLLGRERLQPRFITDEARTRRAMYQGAIRRELLEKEFGGPREEFLASLGMKFTITPAQQQDLHRLEELVARTHQLNTTGYIYTHEELECLLRSDRHELLVASLEDRYGPYGKIGLALIEKAPQQWTIRSFLMSCRVISRGVGSVFLNYILSEARAARVRLLAQMIRNEHNRKMYTTYRLSGFVEISRRGPLEVMEHSLDGVPPCPRYVQLRAVPIGAAHSASA
jgi:FkbH-like protein